MFGVRILQRWFVLKSAYCGPYLLISTVPNCLSFGKTQTSLLSTNSRIIGDNSQARVYRSRPRQSDTLHTAAAPSFLRGTRNPLFVDSLLAAHTKCFFWPLFSVLKFLLDIWLALKIILHFLSQRRRLPPELFSEFVDFSHSRPPNFPNPPTVQNRV